MRCPKSPSGFLQERGRKMHPRQHGLVGNCMLLSGASADGWPSHQVIVMYHNMTCQHGAVWDESCSCTPSTPKNPIRLGRFSIYPIIGRCCGADPGPWLDPGFPPSASKKPKLFFCGLNVPGSEESRFASSLPERRRIVVSSWALFLSICIPCVVHAAPFRNGYWGHQVRSVFGV